MDSPFLAGLNQFLTARRHRCGRFDRARHAVLLASFYLTNLERSLRNEEIAKAVDDNMVDTMSTSFGSPEAFNDLALDGPVTDPFNGEMVSSLQAMHQEFVIATVDYPGSDPAITMAGGTTLPGPQSFNTPSGTVTVNNPVERVWGEDFSHGPAPVLHTISAGDNWFFHGRDGYSPAGGLGTLDVFNFSRVLAPSLS
jgi:hypothetical protein